VFFVGMIAAAGGLLWLCRPRGDRPAIRGEFIETIVGVTINAAAAPEVESKNPRNDDDRRLVQSASRPSQARATAPWSAWNWRSVGSPGAGGSIDIVVKTQAIPATADRSGSGATARPARSEPAGTTPGMSYTLRR
jgi:hypothetical protein